MKKIIYLAVAASTMLFTACESFLDTQDLTHKNTTNFPLTVGDAQQMMAGVYSGLNEQFDNNKYGNIPSKTFYFYSEVASDDRLGGGGANDQGWQAEDMFLQYLNSDLFRQIWTVRYQGVYRANYAIETLDRCTGYTDSIQKNKMKGEAYFLRAYYYYELASLFENIPVLISSTPVNKAQATPAETWGQIISDLKAAINLMPAVKTPASETGHVDKYCAEAMLARAFLFYTGFYKSADVTLPDGSKVIKADVVTWVNDCVQHSGYSLVTSDYRNLWGYTNSLTKEDYTYTKGQNLLFVEDSKAVGSEEMFMIKFSNFAKQDGTGSEGYSDGYALYTSMRGNQNLQGTFPFGQGWGGAPVTPNLWSDWAAAEPTDPRRAATICQIPTELGGTFVNDGDGKTYPKYTKGAWDFVQETDYYMKKTSAIGAKVGGVYYPGFEAVMYNNSAWKTNMQECTTRDLVLIRFADVLLMQSELTGDATGMNKVRARVGLPAIAYSLPALQSERRWELCGEAVRWNDMRRWGDDYCTTALAKQVGVKTYYKGNDDTNVTANNGGGYVARYKATHGFVAIPGSEISLSNGILKQNPGWETPPNYSGWK